MDSSKKKNDVGSKPIDALLSNLSNISNSLPVEWIILIQFGKTRSSNYQWAFEAAKRLPNSTVKDDVIACGAKTIKEYILNKGLFENLIDCVYLWKHSDVRLYERHYDNVAVYHDFHAQISRDAGKYSIFTRNNARATIENLPLPIVYYPNGYGAFFCFSADVGSQIFFCECERQSIEGYLKTRPTIKNIYFDAPLDSNYFPEIVSEMSRKKPSDPLSLFRFQDGLCFRCNHKIPSFTYGSDKVSAFSKHFGWYVTQRFFELGLHPQTVSFDDSVGNSIRVNIENSVRADFGYRRKGESWTSETTLFYLVKGLYPDKDVIFHHRPKWLEGLELDIFIPALKLAFEYQGIQHYKPVEHFGGRTQFKKRIENDERKRILCQANGIKLIVVRYDDVLSERNVRAMISSSDQQTN